MRVLFVCLGNICRSPAAEGVVRARAPDWDTDSAGTGNWHVGEAPYPPMQKAAMQRGVDISDLRARQFRPGDFDRFDLIVVMDNENLEAVERQRPMGRTTPVKLFTDFGPDGAGDIVPDPYYTRDFEGCLNLIESCADGLLLSYGTSPRRC